MITLTDVSPFSIIFVDLMSLTSSFVSRKIYDDVKLLIEGLNKHAESESYAVVIACFKKFKKDVDRIVYIRCDHEGKASLNSANLERRLHSDTRLMKCSFNVVDKRMTDILKSYETRITIISAHSALRRLAMTEKIRESIISLIKVEIEISHGQEVKSSEVKGSEVNVLSHPLSFKRMQPCLQRFICSEEDAETAILKLF
jgi:hypothetical protein